MDFEIIKEYYPLFIDAFYLTIKLACYGVILSFLIGLFCMWVELHRFKFLRLVCNAYIELSRNTPLLIHLFFLYYALPKIGIKLEAFSCGVIGLAFLGGSYMAESLKAGLNAISKHQIEAGYALALSKNQVLYHIILPLSFRVSITSISANIIFLFKETSVVSVIALADLVYTTKDIIGLYYVTNEALFMLCVAYFIMILPLSLILSLVEKRIRR